MHSPVHQFTSSPVIRLAFSPCPNDTFIFYAMTHHKIDTEGIRFDYLMSDVEALNRMAMNTDADMIKVSYHAWLYIEDMYQLLNSGSALGRGNGPLIVSKHPYALNDLKNLRIAIPGELTTGHLLLKIAVPDASCKEVMVFHEIEDAILAGKVDAGVIIHENRFTYINKGLVKVCDLGEFWENLTGYPIPLGGIVAKKSLGDAMICRLNRIMRRSVEYALSHPESVMDFVRANAQELDDDVIKKHISLYVNNYTIDLGIEGRKAISKLKEISKDKTGYRIQG